MLHSPGNDALMAGSAALADLEGQPLAEQVRILGQVHEQLHAALASEE